MYHDRVGDLRDAGILETKDVGNELTKILKQYSPDLSERFNGFVQKGDQFGKQCSIIIISTLAPFENIAL